MIPRIHAADIRENLLHSNKIVLLFGARQAGKTTLILYAASATPTQAPC